MNEHIAARTSEATLAAAAAKRLRNQQKQASMLREAGWTVEPPEKPVSKPAQAVVDARARRRAHEKQAVVLRDAGWVVVAPEHVDDLLMQLVDDLATAGQADTSPQR